MSGMSVETETSTIPGPEFSPRPKRVPARLGEELPVFCEKCGYPLHGLTPIRCAHCEVLHLACPECGHHQPLNTLRPAFQRLLGRIRAAVLVAVVFFKLNFFGWALVGAGAMAFDWVYTYWSPPGNGGIFSTPGDWRARELDAEDAWIFGLSAVGFGLVSRMLLLRWRRSAAVALILACIAVPALITGAYLRQMDVGAKTNPWSGGLVTIVGLTALAVIAGALVALPIWCAVVKLLLPRRTADALLDWQRSQSDRTDPLARL